MYFLGIDAGGTKCRAKLSDASGNIVGQGISGPANIRIGVSKVFNVMQDAYHQAIAEANLDAQAIASIRAGIGVAGISRAGARQELQSQPFPFLSTTLASDGSIANMGAHSGKDGGIVIIGTGSIAVGRLADKDIFIGGYGFPISDEGSGAYIGLQAVRMTLRASDGRIPHTEMTKNIFQRFDNQTSTIVSWMDKASATDYGSLAPFVVEAAKVGDNLGRIIIQRAAYHVELMVRGLFEKGIPRCSLMGGLSPFIEPWLSPDIRLQLKNPDGDALDGALWLARQPD